MNGHRRISLGLEGKAPPWGSQGVLGIALCLASLLVLYRSLPAMVPQALQIQLLYFQPLIPLLFMGALWGWNVKRFTDDNIEYDLCFSQRDRKYLLGLKDVLQIVGVLSCYCLVMAAAFSWLAAQRLYYLVEFVPLLLYSGIVFILLVPLNLLHRPSRQFFATTVQRVLLPVQEVTWADFLLADVFTSLAKCCIDFYRAMCFLGTGPVMQNLLVKSFKPSGMCTPLASGSLLALCLPYIIRFIQCITVYRATGNKAQIFNAIKYSSAFPALVFSAWEHEYHVRNEAFPYRTWWLAAVLINSLYSYYWDVEQDWDMPWIMQGNRHSRVPWLPSLKPDSCYSTPWYAWALLSNLALRLSWTHRLMGSLEAHSSVALVLALLEAFRRYQWMYIRVETELRKIQLRLTHGGRSSSGNLQLGPITHSGPAGTSE